MSEIFYRAGGDLGFLGGNVPEAGESAHGITQTDDGAEGKVEKERDLEKQGSGKVAQGSGNPDTGEYIDKRQVTVAE